MGLRWEFYPPATPVQKGGFSNYEPNTNTLRVSGYGDIPDNLGIATHKKYLHRDSALPIVGTIPRSSAPDSASALRRSRTTATPTTSRFVQTMNSIRPSLLLGSGASGGQIATFQNGFPDLIQPVVPDDGISPIRLSRRPIHS